MKKKITSIVGAILIVVLIWYLFIKPYDYLVTFKAKTSPGTINQSIKSWSSSQDKSEIIKQKSLDDLMQQISFNDSTYIYHWKIDIINDSISKVKVFVKDTSHSFSNKISIPFKNTDFEKRTKNTLIDFNSKLQEHLKKIKVTIEGENKTEATYCAYIPVKTTQVGKAGGMMEYYTFLSGFIAENKIELNGKPTIEVTYWNMKNDSLYYNFCFPIIKKDSLPSHRLIKYKELQEKKALKAIYNGNYITSDRAWYALLGEAEKKAIKINKRPIEVFHNNPNMGGNELDWKTEVYMPIQ